MTVPAFEEYVPAVDCTCAGCAAQRRAARALPTRYGGHPAAHGARRALVMVTAAGVVLGTGAAEAASAATGHPAESAGSAGAAGSVASARADPTPTRADPELSDPSDPGDPDPADLADPGDPADLADPGDPADLADPEDSDSDDSESGTPQGAPGPLRGSGAAGPPSSTGSAPETPKTTRTDIIKRAKKWVSEQVPYSMAKYWSDGYRQDCSGYVSMAWKLRSNEWTGSLAEFGTKIAREELQPGDILLFHNKANPTNGSHVTIFGGWTDYTHSHYSAYEQTPSHTRKRTTPMAYWSHSGSYIPYRYKGLPTKTSSSSSKALSAFPGAAKFGPGASNTYVTRLGRMLMDRGGKRFYKAGPGPDWGEADRRATQTFQKAQGWAGKEADGIPGPDTWRLLVSGTGRSIPESGSGDKGGSTAAPAFPGRDHFRPGQSNSHVDKLGKQLVRKGYGKHYAKGPGPRWTEEDRRNVEAFQRAQGWRGAEADGYPGPETWQRLFA
ncbi:peptidoglycan-binding protein [Streptomyces sp. NBC_01744]|uniref:peptidoglycan-binding protein n=1 Tax=Streptomyces sp. NBC_01744 TaxID=2975927 RepID=UPI003D9A900E|nr:peptidoglycan-binding protein [Streptomyces sp. NBC_01744]